MLSLALFPGQGSQRVGMGSHMISEFPYTKRIYEEAEDATHLNLRKLCFEGPSEELNQTFHAQPCVLATSLALWSVIREETPFRAAYFAGHSLGEYSALVASEKLELATAALLVRKRGIAMQEAFPQKHAAMLALVGELDLARLDRLCLEVSQQCEREAEETEKESGHRDLVAIANINSSHQVVVSGSKRATLQLKTKLPEVFSSSIRAIPLAVSAPFHCRLMAQATEVMAPELYDLSFKHSPYQIISNVTGALEVPYSPKRLVEQIEAPVQWLETYNSALSLGVERLLEVGASNILAKMWRKEKGFSQLQVLCTDNLQHVLEVLQKDA